MIDITSDNHVHTNYSPDADPNATFDAYITKAKELGLSQITFTDHVDFDPAHPLFNTPIDYDTYMSDYLSVKKKQTDISLRMGVEIGYQTHMKSKINNFLKSYPFEHIILSIHYIEKKDLYTKEYFVGKSKHEAYNIYFLSLLEAVTEIDSFDVVGHFDYITRYSPFGDYEYEEYKDVIDQILQVLVQKNKGIEINTSGFVNEQRAYPKSEIIDRFIELGGRKITLGSDAHSVTELGRFFNKI